MGKVDEVDQERGFYPIRLSRAKRSWINLFFWLLEILLHNVMIIYNHLASAHKWTVTNQRDIRIAISEYLIANIEEANVPKSTNSPSHTPSVGENKNSRCARCRCFICHKLTKHYCSSSTHDQVWLCISRERNCWESYHATPLPPAKRRDN